ncbi:unnamed protein product [Urochloa humidicola]
MSPVSGSNSVRHSSSEFTGSVSRPVAECCPEHEACAAGGWMARGEQTHGSRVCKATARRKQATSRMWWRTDVTLAGRAADWAVCSKQAKSAIKKNLQLESVGVTRSAI